MKSFLITRLKVLWARGAVGIARLPVTQEVAGFKSRRARFHPLELATDCVHTMLWLFSYQAIVILSRFRFGLLNRGLQVESYNRGAEPPWLTLN